MESRSAESKPGRSDYDRIRADHIREYGEGTRHLAFLDRLYPDRTHFLFELLQNAEDAGAGAVKLALYGDRLEVRHDGRPFDERDVRAICGVDAGSKAGDLTKIGKYGIGFKSVYAYTGAPEVHCDEEHFRIEAYVRPFAAPERQTAPGETLFVLPFSRQEVNAERSRSEIAARLEQLAPAILLFLRRIRRVEWTIEGGGRGAIERRIEDEAIDASGSVEERRVELRRTTTEAETREPWLVFARRKPIAAEADDRSLERWVEIAFRLQRDPEHGSEQVKAVPSHLVVFFPTDRETHLGFLVQGPFKTTPARDNVPSDDVWNRSLIEDAAALTVEVLPRLRERGLLDVHCLEALPIRAADFPRDGMFRAFFERVRQAFQDHPLLPATTAPGSATTCTIASRARLASAQALRDLLSSEQLTALYRSAEPLAWLDSRIDASATPDLHQYVRFQLGVDETTPEALAVRCDEKFLAAQSDDWMVRFYAFLAVHPALWQPAGGPWGSQPGTLRERPILRLAGGAHVQPFRADGAPAAYLPPLEPTEYPVVEPRVAADPRAREFLLRLGLREPDVVAEVLERILEKYGSAGGVDPRGEEHRRDFEKILRALAAASDAERRHLVGKLERTAFVRCRNAATGEERLRAPTQAYLRRRELAEYFEGNDTAWFVDEDGEPDPEHGGWAVLGVAARPRRVGDDRALSLDEKRMLRGERQARWTGDRDVIDYELHGLDRFLARFDGAGDERAEMSPLLWQILCELCDGTPHAGRQRAFQGEYRWFYHDEELSAFFPSAFLVRLQQHAWLPSPDGRFVKPAEVALAGLPSEFYREEALAAALGMGLGELDRFAREHGVSADLLRFAVEYPEEVEQLRRRHLDDRPDELEPEAAPSPAAPIDFGGALADAFSGRDDQADRAAPASTAPAGVSDAFGRDELTAGTPAGGRMLKLGEIDRARFARVSRRIWTQADGILRSFFHAQYDGHCQVCDASFRMRSGAPYWEGLYLVPSARARFPNRPGNVLALCATCCAKFLYGSVEAGDLRDQVERQAAASSQRLRVRLCGEAREIRFTPEHLADLRAILAEG